MPCPDPHPGSFTIRPATGSDSRALGKLMGQLGYEIPGEELLRRTNAIRRTGGEVFVAARGDGMVAGCVQAMLELRLAEGEFAELVSLVVDADCRKQGIGGMLVKAVEDWCRTQGTALLRVRCNNARSGALRFYAKAGFDRKKEQAILEKTLLPA